MSRCFPYPPPGYLRQGLVESIKLEREKVVAKTEQKIHKNREKKEKKKERKEKERSQSRIKKIKKLDDCLNGFKGDQSESSNITVEHEAPVCYISDGFQNSNKRKRENHSSSSSECRVDGNVIKIRFSLKKPRQPDAPGGKEPVCSTSVSSAESSPQPKAQEQSCPLSKKAKTVISLPKEKHRPCDERRQVTPLPEQKQWLDDERREQIPSSSGTSAYDDEMHKAALLYKTFIEDWVPLPLQFNQNVDEDSDGDWLFKTRQEVKPATKRSIVDNDVACRASATSCPRGHFLPEAEIYALPYTVPF